MAEPGWHYMIVPIKPWREAAAKLDRLGLQGWRVIGVGGGAAVLEKPRPNLGSAEREEASRG